jgi:hydrogenase maturation factor
MCITRVGRVLSTSKGKAVVSFFDGRTSEDIDLSIVPAEKGAYVEVFGNVVLSTLSAAEARRRQAMWKEIRTAIRKESLQGVSRT